jgi:hypothetical protein
MQEAGESKLVGDLENGIIVFLDGGFSYKRER